MKNQIKNNNRFSALCLLMLGIYLQAVEWIDMFPWNNVKNGNGQETMDLLLAVGFVILIVWLWVGRKLAAFITSLALSFWLWLQIQTWWIPYFNGATDHWERVYLNWFSETTQFMQVTENHYPPDANHLLLQALIVLCLLSNIRALTLKKKRY